jgi:hypothetical protein
VLVGGNGPTVEDRVLDFGDAWFPNWTDAGVLDRIQALRARANRPIDVMVMGLHADPAEIESCLAAGCRRVVHWIRSGNRAVVEHGFERWEAAIAQVTGEG